MFETHQTWPSWNVLPVVSYVWAPCTPTSLQQCPVQKKWFSLGLGSINCGATSSQIEQPPVKKTAEKHPGLL